VGGGNNVSYDWLVFLVSLKAIVDVPIRHLKCVGELVHRLQGGVQQLVVAHAEVEQEVLSTRIRAPWPQRLVAAVDTSGQSILLLIQITQTYYLSSFRLFAGGEST
jgi:hypothetical protein